MKRFLIRVAQFIKRWVLLFSRIYSRRRKNLWVFGEWFGRRCCDNCLYFANYIAQNHPEISLIWSTHPGTDVSRLDKSITVVENDSEKARGFYLHAGVVIINEDLCDITQEDTYFYFGRAFVLNLWHGAPWKKIARASLPPIVGNFLRKAYIATINRLRQNDSFLVTSNDFADIVVQNFGIRKENIIRGGYPRNSDFYHPERVREIRRGVLNKLESLSLGGRLEGCRLIAYMPTFRDHTGKVFSFKSVASDKRLNEILETYNAIIVQKGHFVSEERRKGLWPGDEEPDEELVTGTEGNETKTTRIIEIDDVSAAELLAAADILITDYSSCFFDFLLLNRPIIHFLYDYDYYAGEDRGLLYKKEDIVCGDSPQTFHDLLEALDQNLNMPDKYSELRKQRRRKYMTYESADSCQVLYKEICKRVGLTTQA